MVPRPGVLYHPGNVLEIHITGPVPDLWNQKLGVEPCNLWFKEPSG